jgi:hypothetical protein|tara:strand:- start:3470 stop:4423 length:954 start_codon:yes stop_codon:yes gene_type:complete
MGSTLETGSVVMLAFTNLVFVGIVIWILSNLDIKAGLLYLSLMLLATMFLVWIFFWFKEEDYIKNLLPFETKMSQVIFSYTIGFFVPILLFGVGNIVKFFGVLKSNLFTFVEFSFAPLASFSTGTTGGVQTFAAVKATNDPLLIWFTATKGASRIEELVAGFAFLIISGFMIIGVLKLIDYILNLNIPVSTYKKVFFWGGFIGSILFFIGIHRYNQTYVGQPILFVFAGVFRALVNFVIFKIKGLGFFFAWAIHDSTNNLSLIFDPQFGIGKWFEAITSPLGTFVILIDIIIIAGFFIKWKDMLPQFPDIFKLKATA